MARPSSPGDLRFLRQENRRRALETLWAEAPLSRRDLAQKTGLSAATTSEIVASWVSSGLAREEGPLPSGGGRPQVPLVPNPRFGRLVGVAVAEGYALVQVFDFCLGALGPSLTVPLTSGGEAPQALRQAVLAAAAPPGPGPLRGLGLALPGPMDRATGRLSRSPNVPWDLNTLIEGLEGALPGPVAADNSALAAGLAEATLARPRPQDMVCLLWGNGLGASVLSEGRWFRGAGGRAGEVGQLPLGTGATTEELLGAQAVLRRFWDEVHPGQALPGPPWRPALEACLDDLDRGLPAARRAAAALRGPAQGLVEALGSLYDPERIRISGWLGLRLAPHLGLGTAGGIPVEVSPLGPGGILQGAACLVLQRLFAST